MRAQHGDRSGDLDLDRFAMHQHHMLHGARGMRLGRLGATGTDAHLIELTAAPGSVKREQRPGRKGLIRIEQQLGLFMPQHRRAILGGFLHQGTERHTQSGGDFPQGGHRRHGTAVLNLVQHGPAHPGTLGQLVQGKAALGPQLP